MNLFTSRRRFIEITPFAGIALLAGCSPKSERAAPATNNAPPEPISSTPTPTPAATNTAALPKLDEKDAQAVALGYVEDATKADTTRFKNYVAGNQCSNCTLYQGKADETAGPCSLFAGKNVMAKGWCTSWVKKA